MRAGPAHAGGWALPARLRPWTLCGRSQCMVPWPVRTRSFLTGGLGGRPASAPDPHCVPSPGPCPGRPEAGGSWEAPRERGRGGRGGVPSPGRNRRLRGEGATWQLGSGRPSGAETSTRPGPWRAAHVGQVTTMLVNPSRRSQAAPQAREEPDAQIRPSCRALGQRSLGQRVWGQPPPLGDPHLPP